MKNETKKYLLVAVIMIVLVFATGCGATQFNDGTGSGESFLLPVAEGMFGKGGMWDWLVYPMAWLMNFIASNIVGFNYALTILIATILIRSLAWPIYGKTNDMSLKMKILGPEQAKIEEKYRNKTDRESMQRKSMETMQLYKKYKISFFGCFMPLLQMPIFLAFYETLRRIPYTSLEFLARVGNVLYDKNGNELLIQSVLYDFGRLNTNLFGIDLMKTANEGGTWQRWGVYLIAALVAITQLGTQLLSQWRANKQKEKLDSGLPDYRRPNQTDQQKQMEKTMKIMLYAMPVMMVVFIVTNTAALGWYWLVGNIYTFIQTIISSKSSEKRLQKLKEKYDDEKPYLGSKRY